MTNIVDLLPFAISGTRTIEPGRALIKVPAANDATKIGVELSTPTEHTVGMAWTTFASAFAIGFVFGFGFGFDEAQAELAALNV